MIFEGNDYNLIKKGVPLTLRFYYMINKNYY
jgi:hypothetical protein